VEGKTSYVVGGRSQEELDDYNGKDCEKAKTDTQERERRFPETMGAGKICLLMNMNA